MFAKSYDELGQKKDSRGRRKTASPTRRRCVRDRRQTVRLREFWQRVFVSWQSFCRPLAGGPRPQIQAIYSTILSNRNVCKLLKTKDRSTFYPSILEGSCKPRCAQRRTALVRYPAIFHQLGQKHSSTRQSKTSRIRRNSLKTKDRRARYSTIFRAVRGPSLRSTRSQLPSGFSHRGRAPPFLRSLRRRADGQHIFCPRQFGGRLA